MATQDRNAKVDGLQLTDCASSKSESSTEKSRNGVVLVPRPSDDPRDPLVGLPRFGNGDLDLLI